MKQVIRQVFGTTRPRDIWLDLFTFNRLLSKPIVHIIYWCGLALLLLSACVVLGVAIGQAWKDGTVMGWVLSIPILVMGWLPVLIGVLLWRAACEFFLAVLSIAEDLSALRMYQEKLELPPQSASPRTQAEYDAPPPQPEPEQVRPAAEPTMSSPTVSSPTVSPGDILEDPFFRPRFERRDI